MVLSDYKHCSILVRFMVNAHENKATVEVVFIHVRMMSVMLNEAKITLSKFRPIISYLFPLLLEYLLQDVLGHSFLLTEKAIKENQTSGK